MKSMCKRKVYGLSVMKGIKTGLEYGYGYGMLFGIVKRSSQQHKHGVWLELVRKHRNGTAGKVQIHPQKM